MEQSGPGPPLPVSALATPRWHLGTEASGLHEEFHLVWGLNCLCPVKAACLLQSCPNPIVLWEKMAVLWSPFWDSCYLETGSI